ncbi:MAG: hypothetical protein AAF532_03680 [Planctomycetota bacterium]
MSESRERLRRCLAVAEASAADASRAPWRRFSVSQAGALIEAAIDDPLFDALSGEKREEHVAGMERLLGGPGR